MTIKSRAVIAQMWQDWQYVLDPHTACAFTDMAQDRVSVVLATAIRRSFQKSCKPPPAASRRIRRWRR
jgi:hypothetical protein